MTKLHSLFALLVFANAGIATHSFAADEVKETLTFHTDWKGERIELPPRFAPAMTLKGTEEIRFAPGMFDAKSDSFFTYAFVFSVPKAQELTPELIQKELLAYYRGLAEAVSKGKGRPVDGSKFTFATQPSKDATATPEKLPAFTKVAQYSGELNWIEPFATAQPQVLHFEIQAWADPATARNYLFVCASPKVPGETDTTWKELRQIRRSFEITSQ
jgi:hypothetical protein